MSKYTTEVRFICETLSGLSESAGGNSVENIIATARPKVFDFEFPIFDRNYLPTLETKILKHFYTREIGQETVGLWKLKLNTKLNEIMPYYNQLYNSELIEFNPMYDVNYTRSGSESLSQSESTSNSQSTTESHSSSQSESYSASMSEQLSESLSVSESETASENERNSLLPNTNSWELIQDTPQNGLTGVSELNYLTKAVKNTNGGDTQEYINKGQSGSRQALNTTNRTAGNINNHSSGMSASDQGNMATTSSGTRNALDTKGYLESIVGYRSNNPSKLLEDFRDTFLNIDMMIIHELEPLFMQLW